MDVISKLNSIKQDQDFWDRLIMTDKAIVLDLEVTWIGNARIDRDDHYILKVLDKYYAIAYDELASYETVTYGDFFEVDFKERPVVVQDWFKK